MNAVRAGARLDPVLAGAHPLSADLHDLPVSDGMVERATADAIPCLENHDRVALCDQVGGGAQSGEPCSDHDHVDLSPAARGRRSGARAGAPGQ